MQNTAQASVSLPVGLVRIIETLAEREGLSVVDLLRSTFPATDALPDSGRPYLVHLTSTEAEALEGFVADTGVRASTWLADAAATAIESAASDESYLETTLHCAIAREPLHPWNIESAQQ